MALLEAGDEEGQPEPNEFSAEPDLVTFDTTSEWSEYNFAYYVATRRSNTEQQRKIDRAFRESPLNNSDEALARWEAAVAFTHMKAGQPATLQSIRDRVTAFPKSSHLLRILGDALEHHGDTEGAAKAYSEAIMCAADIENAATVIARAFSSTTESRTTIDLQSVRSKLLELPHSHPRTEIAFGLSMRNLAASSGLQQITQAIDETNVKQSPDDNALKFNLAFSYSDADPDLALFHYDSVPRGERSSEGWNNLGVAYSKLQMPGLAVEAYEAASERGETVADGNLANKLLAAGFFTMARDRAQKAVSLPNYNDNVVAALRAIRDAEAEEEQKLTTAKETARKKQRFIRQLGYAALRLEEIDILGAWRTPEGILEISIQNSHCYLAAGEFTHQRNANALGLSGLLRPNPVTDTTIVIARFRRFGDAFEGTIHRKPKDPSTSGLLGSLEREHPIAIYPIDNDTLHVCVRDFERQETEWKRLMSINPPSG